MLVKYRSTRLGVENLWNTLLSLEYSREFTNLKTDEEKKAFILNYAEMKIVHWHERNKNFNCTYMEWRDCLLKRFYKRIPD